MDNDSHLFPSICIHENKQVALKMENMGIPNPTFSGPAPKTVTSIQSWTQFQLLVENKKAYEY